MNRGVLHWERLESADGPVDMQTFRSRVPGGWLVAAFTFDRYGHGSAQKALSLTFVPDETHVWDGSSLPDG